MGGPGFAKLGNQLIRENKNLKDTLKRKSQKPGKHKNGKQALRFTKAGKSKRKTISYDKTKIQKQLKFRVGLLLVGLIFVTLLLILLFTLE